LYVVNIDPLININECFSEKCKHLKNSFNKLKLKVSKNSLNFKFNFYKALNSLNLKIQSEIDINITKNEYESLKIFKDQNKYIIIECDKNIGTCIINKKLYEEFAFSHLNDRIVYTKIQIDPLESTQITIKNTIEKLYKNKQISKRLYQNFFNKNAKLGSFRLLAKLTKKVIGFRPIINCREHPTVFICLFIDTILQPFVKTSKSYIKDSQNLMQLAANKSFPKDSKLFSCDFESLYTNIDLKKALIVLTQFISKNYSNIEMTTLAFYELLKLVFENNLFTFNKKYYKQIKGVAMGAKCAPVIAGLYLCILEDNYLVIYKPLFYCRFIDDIFIILSRMCNIQILLESFENLKLNVVTDTTVVFLDLSIKLDPITGILIFSLYTKPTNTFAYLLYNSNHPRFIFENIPLSLFIRLRRICSIFSDYLYFSRKLILQLLTRGYNIELLLHTFRIVCNMKRLNLLQYKEKKKNSCGKKIFFKFPYDNNMNCLDTVFNTAFNSIASVNFLTKYNFSVIKYMQPNLASILIHNFQMFSFKKYKFKRCKDLKCVICLYANEDHYLIINSIYVPIMANSNCKSLNIIYILTCKLCNELYIGQTECAKTRLKTHIRVIRYNRTQSNCVCVMEHFNQLNHFGLKNFSINIFTTNLTNKWTRLNTETQLMHFFIKIGGILINELIPSLYYWYTNVNLFLEKD